MQQTKHLRQGVVFGLDRKSDRACAAARAATAPAATATAATAAAARAQSRIQTIQFITQLLVGELLGASHHQFWQKAGRGFKAFEVLLVPVMEREGEMHFLVARFLL